MSDVESPAAEAASLTQLQRITNTFTAPSKTFEDIKRGNRSWWLPFIVMALISYAFFAVVNQKVGIQQAVENQIRMNPQAQERTANQNAQQRAAGEKIAIAMTDGVFIAAPLMSVIAALIVSLGLLGTINFVFGGRAKYNDVLAMSFYAWLPSIVKVLLGMVVLYAGMAPESFNLKNFAPTNAAAFLDPTSTSPVLYSLAGSLDIVTIWTLILLGMGTAIVAGVKRSSGYIAVFAWWAIFVLLGAAMAAIFG